MQPQLNKKSVREALRKFDRDLRDTVEWGGWLENKTHKYAIFYNGKKYPVKKIASLASGVAVSEFSGGRYAGHTNELLEAVGFKVAPLRGLNPDWVRDELVLALNLYLKHRRHPPGKASKEIRELSENLNRLGKRLFLPSQRSGTFRNVSGVYMKLMNFRRLDPEYTKEGKKGLTAGAKAEEEVWKEFANDPIRCERVANAIIASLDDTESYILPSDEDIDDGFEDAPEGRLLTRRHLTRERNRKLVEKKKAQIRKKNGKLRCEVCDFDFDERYGERGLGFIECHHTKPLATLAEGHKTRISDLALVCANCHRMIHRAKPWLTIDEVKAILRVPDEVGR